MIFVSAEELRDINEYRYRAMNRKQEAYNRLYPDKFKGIDQFEWDALECIERLRDYVELPFIDVKEIGDISEARKKIDLKADRTHSSLDTNGNYTISIDTEAAVLFGRDLDRIFGKPWTKNRIEMYAKMGIEYCPYEKSLYSFPFFRKFNICRSELFDFIHKMALWFMVLHEVAHVYAGHLRLKQDVDAGLREMDLDTLRALELHADLMASEFLLKIMDGWGKYYDKRQLILRGSNRYPRITYCDEITLASIAASLALREYQPSLHWDEYSIGMHESYRETHPIIELRIAAVSAYFLNHIQKLGQTAEERNAFTCSYFNAVKQFESFILQNVVSEGHDMVFYKPAELLRTERGKEYFRRVFDCLMNCNVLLSNYTENRIAIEGKWFDYETLPEQSFWDEQSEDFS